MRPLVFFMLLLFFTSGLMSQENGSTPISIFSFSLEFELNNDQGDLPTKDYLKQYGTKGKTRAVEAMYPILVDFMSQEFEKKSFVVNPFTKLASEKANVYGIPALSLSKAVKLDAAENYLKISLKDIGQVPPGQLDGASGSVVKIVKMRCRLQLYDSSKNLLKEAEGFFATGEKVGGKYNIGIDLRQYQGTGREQELKFYEACCKMAFLRALESF